MEQLIRAGETVRGIVVKLRSSPTLTSGGFHSNPLLSEQPQALGTSVSCAVCDDTGWEPETENGVRRMRRCKCTIERRRRALLKRLREWLHSFRLQELTTCEDTVRCFAPAEIQRRVIDLLRTNPDGSYAFFGPPGWAKSHYLAALYSHAVETQGTACYYIQASELVRGFRELELYQQTKVCLADETLRLDSDEGIRSRIFLDEVERLPTMSQFTWGKIADFFDLIYRMAGRDSSKVQLCLASNLTRMQFRDLWGAAILRRINEQCSPIDLFECSGCRR